MTAQPRDIADAMGGPDILGQPVASVRDLEELVLAGIPKRAVAELARRVFADAAARRHFVYGVVPEATYKRRTRLTPAESERTERLARIVAEAQAVWDDEAAAAAFLTTPHPLLEHRPPLDVAMTEPGARRVERILANLEWGLPV